MTNNMKVFQIMKGEVLIINADKQYTDTVENFKLDSGLTLENLNEVIYDSYQECCVVNKEFLEYPNADFDGYIASVDKYIAAKVEREYVPLAEPTPEEKLQQQANETKSKLMEQKDNLLMAMLTGTDTAPVVANYAVMLTAVDDSVAEKIPEMFPAWDGNGKQYKTGDRVQYSDVLYKVLQDHTSQSTWTPTDAPSLFAKVLTSTDGTPQEW
ncbi:carbohydrate-binding protein [Megamonas hypermegale]|uniref:carbohydrate-binding protein n=1 Tax=Megamonas hypermegale TaxID=158847 RepID=UPI0026EF2855|nr:carbohydrate-binding protein [Megamonas hypermegale]